MDDDGNVGDDGGDEVERRREQTTSRAKDITAHVDKVVASAAALSQTVRGHEDTITSAKDMDVTALVRANGVLDALDLGDCERIEQYMHDLAVVQRATVQLRSNEKDIVACEKSVQKLEEINALKLQNIPFLKVAKPVV